LRRLSLRLRYDHVHMTHMALPALLSKRTC
jgi:hypothetical protein